MNHLLIVDDEPLARARLRSLLVELAGPAAVQPAGGLRAAGPTAAGLTTAGLAAGLTAAGAAPALAGSLWTQAGAPAAPPATTASLNGASPDAALSSDRLDVDWSDVGEAASATDAMQWLLAPEHQPAIVLLDIHMPGTDGMALAHALRQRSHALSEAGERLVGHSPPLLLPAAIIFVTAHTEHALEAFDLDAVDYLTKPVRLERLRAALVKAQRWLQTMAERRTSGPDHLLIHDRGRTERIPLRDIIYLKAELKYVTVRTCQRSYIFDGSLQDLEQQYPGLWQRVHRNALVARRALRALEKVHDPVEGEGWAVKLDGVEERLMVSRRQLPAVREALVQG